MAFLVPTAMLRTGCKFSWLHTATSLPCHRAHCTSSPSPSAHRSQVRMASNQPNQAEVALVHRVLSHWFGPMDVSRYVTLENKQDLWYRGGKDIDDDIRVRFGGEVEKALDGKLDHFIGSQVLPIKSDLALVILLDQYTRNIYRGTPDAFAGDRKSRMVLDNILKPEQWSAAKRILHVPAQTSFLLPLMHQENVHDLDLCIAKVDDLIHDCQSAGDQAVACAQSLEQMRSYAERHRDIIVQFGRYPHRNDVLGRKSTKEELRFLENGPRFGQ